MKRTRWTARSSRAAGSGLDLALCRGPAPPQATFPAPCAAAHPSASSGSAERNEPSRPNSHLRSESVSVTTAVPDNSHPCYPLLPAPWNWKEHSDNRFSAERQGQIWTLPFVVGPRGKWGGDKEKGSRLLAWTLFNFFLERETGFEGPQRQRTTA